jgi:glycosyltransferase involved in cell wall biosynthesis
MSDLSDGTVRSLLKVISGGGNVYSMKRGRVLVCASAPRSLLNFRRELLAEMVARGHEVVAGAAGPADDVESGLAALGVQYYNIPIQRAGLNPIRDWQTLSALGQLYAWKRPDVVLAYTAKPVIYSGLAARHGKPAVFAMITGLGYGFGSGSLRQLLIGFVMKKLYRAALRNCAGVFFQNPDDRELFSNRQLVSKRTPVHMINGSGVNLDWYAQAPLPSEPTFLLVARLLVEKGVRQYAEAAAMVRAKFPVARCLLVGDVDPNPSSIRVEELDSWQTSGAIEYLGRLEDVRPAYARASVYVLPSFYREGTPRSVLEAMAMGRPVITTDAPGCRETVVDGLNGFLVPVKNSEALAEAMEKFIKNPALIPRMGQESLRMAREKYDVHKVNKVILEAMGL